MAAANIPLPSEGASGPPNATATCFCGAVQISFVSRVWTHLKPTHLSWFAQPSREIKQVHICHCTACHKIHSSMFGSNFVLNTSVTTHTRGKDKLTKYTRSDTTTTGNTMENDFCSVCGTLMYRIGSGFPGVLIARIGTVDDFNLHQEMLKPEVEQFAKDRVRWLQPAKEVLQDEGFHYK